MTANSTQRTERLTRNNALLLLVDHQVGLYTGVRDIDTLQLKHNIVDLTQAMLALKVPIVLTTTTENMWGPIIPELAEVLTGVQRIERTTVNAWDEKRVVAAVKATGRKNLIVTGISTDVCLALPAMAALADGFQSYAVIDASGSVTGLSPGLANIRATLGGVQSSATALTVKPLPPVVDAPISAAMVQDVRAYRAVGRQARNRPGFYVEILGGRRHFNAHDDRR